MLYVITDLIWDFLLKYNDTESFLHRCVSVKVKYGSQLLKNIYSYNFRWPVGVKSYTRKKQQHWPGNTDHPLAWAASAGGPRSTTKYDIDLRLHRYVD